MISKDKAFLDADFLLENDYAIMLYHSYAATTPIIDYHNHLSPKDIATNRQFTNLHEIWLEGDHYKWRAMRAHGVDEQYITGRATPKEKFLKWAETVPYTMRNPLYHWTHLELQRYFGIHQLLNADSAEEIYETCSPLLQTKDYTVQALLTKQKVELLCTTDDPVDSLQYHRSMKDHASFTMLPTFRPDKAYAFENVVHYQSYLEQLSAAADCHINSLQALLDALSQRIDFFEAQGCRAADHGLEHLPFGQLSKAEAEQKFKSLLEGKSLSASDAQALRAYVLLTLSEIYHSKQWVQQFHLGALRNNNSRMTTLAGADSGFDSIGDFAQAKTMSWFFNELDSQNRLAKTIIYNLNPADNAVFASMIGNFNGDNTPGKMQYGAAWWFLDQKDGIVQQLNMLSNLGLLSHFIGMVTDSRSFLSFPRHEYFRRILCNLLGRDIARGELPNDINFIGTMIRNICYFNTKKYFRLA